MDTSELSRRMGIVHNILWGHLGLMLVLLLAGNGPRTFTDQIAWWLGLGLSAGKEPDGHVFVLHLASTLTIALILWMMRDGHPRLRQALWVGAAAALFTTPVSGVMVPLFIWLARRPDLFEAVDRMPEVAGRSRATILTVWGLASIAVGIASVAAFLLVQVNPLGWIFALALATLPHYATLYLLVRPRAAHSSITAGMPALPEMQTGKS